MAPVVADASALIALGTLNRLELMRDLFQQVTIPPAVSREVSRSLPQLPEWIRVVEPHAMNLAQGVRGLDPGEIEAMAVAVDLGAALIILDDLSARQHAAMLGLAIVGTAGVLVMAKLRQDLYEQILADVGEAPRS